MHKLKTSFLLSSLILFSVNLASQTIEYDFFKREYIKGIERKATFNKPINIKILNINKLKYNISVNSTEIRFNENVPSNLTSLFKREDINDEPLADIPSQTLMAINKAAYKAAVPAPPYDLSTILNSYNSVIASYNVLLKIKIYKNELIDAINTEDVKNINNNINKVSKNYEDLDISKIENFKSNISIFLNEDILLKTNSKFLNDYNSNPNLKDSYDKMFNKVIKLNDVVDSTNYFKLLSDCHKIELEGRKIENFSYSSHPIIANGDEIIFDVKFTSKNNLDPNIEVEQSELKFNVPVKNGFKFDFSTGIAGILGLHDKKYRTEKISTDSSTIKEIGNTNMFNISVAALTHFSWRSTRLVKPSFSFGLGTQSDLSNTQYLLGLSLIVGKKERLIFSGGGAFSKINYLNKKYEIDKALKNDEIRIEDLLVPSNRSGWFVSLTYNLFGKK